MKLRHEQRGMTAIGWLIILALIGFFAMLALRLTPIYLEWYTVSGSLESIKNEPGAGSWTKEDIKSRLDRHFTINQVTRVDLKEHLKIERDEKTGLRKVTIKYDVTTPIAGNIDALVHFSKTVQLPSSTE